MKRLVLAVTGTITGVVALLSFKTQAPVAGGAATLPQAALGASSTTGSSATTPAPTSTTPASSAPTRTSASPSSSAAVSTARTYKGNAITTRYGVIQVRVTITGHKITDVGFARLDAFDGHSQEINSFSAPQLLQETLSSQSAKVDTVSGATYTSDGYRQSLQSALDEAGF